MKSQKYLTYDEIAVAMRWVGGAYSARNRLSKGRCMPPSIRVGRRRLFREDLFHEWLKGYSDGTEVSK